jgi:hypothetical protein
MRSRTLCLLALSAAVAATTAAIPALAASSPVAHGARTRHCDVVVVISHGRRVHACLIRGARGPRGFPGPASTRGPQGIPGKNGKNGKNGTNGKNGATVQGPQGSQGIQGPAGTARAYAVITPSAEVLAAQSFNITAVNSPKSGIYCVTAAAPINPAGDSAVVSAEISYSTPEAPGLVALNAQRKNCPSSTFEVDTYAPGTSTLAGGYAFTIVIP